MKIVVIEHAQERMMERGATLDDVRQTLDRGTSVKAKGNRRAKELVFMFNDLWLGREYTHKKLKVVFIEETDTIVVITVYVSYGSWR